MAIQPGKRDKKTEIQRNVIKEAALSLFREFGFSNVTVTDICQKGKVSIGSFYHYYQSKENLLYICIYTLRDEYLKNHFVLDPEKPIATLFREFFLLNAKYNVTIPKKLLGEAYGTWVSLKVPQDTSKERAYIKIINELVDIGLKRNAFKLDYSAGDLFVLINTLITGNAITWCVSQCDEKHYYRYSEDLAGFLFAQ